MQIVLSSPSAARLQTILTIVREKGALARNERIAVDVDPVSLLWKWGWEATLDSASSRITSSMILVGSLNRPARRHCDKRAIPHRGR